MSKKTLTLEQLQKFIGEYVSAKEQTSKNFVATFDEITNLINTIGKIYTIEQNYIDKLPELSGEDLSNGRIIEEYFCDLLMPQEDLGTGTDALSPSDPTYRKPYYSYPLKKVKFKQTIRFDLFQDVTHNSAEFNALASQVIRRLYDSELLYGYGQKRQLLGNLREKLTTNDDGLVLKIAPNSTEKCSGEALGKEAIGSIIGLKDKKKLYNIYKELKATETYAEAIADGKLIENKMMYVNSGWTFDEPNSVSKEDLINFIQAIKIAVEEASDNDEGNSLSGNTTGVQSGLKLYVRQGVKPLLETEVLAGIFNPDKLALPVEVKVIKDFGEGNDDIVAMLIDPRGIKLHRDYFSAKDQLNADGDWINYFLHTLHTGFISANTFNRVFTTTPKVGDTILIDNKVVANKK